MVFLIDINYGVQVYLMKTQSIIIILIIISGLRSFSDSYFSSVRGIFKMRERKVFATQSQFFNSAFDGSWKHRQHNATSCNSLKVGKISSSDGRIIQILNLSEVRILAFKLCHY